MPDRPIGVVAALRTELAPLLRGRRAQRVEGVELFEVDSAMVALGGIGKMAARRAAETLVRCSGLELLISAGIGGAASPQLKVGDVGWARGVVDAETGERYPARGGEWVVASVLAVGGPETKRQLREQYGADVVDMEAAAVAQVAREHGLGFAAVKAISDEAEFVMPPLANFIEESGRFDRLRFVAHIAVRPQWWPAVNQLRANSRVASVNLSDAVKHLINNHSSIRREEKVPLS